MVSVSQSLASIIHLELMEFDGSIAERQVIDCSNPLKHSGKPVAKSQLACITYPIQTERQMAGGAGKITEIEIPPPRAIKGTNRGSVFSKFKIHCIIADPCSSNVPIVDIPFAINLTISGTKLGSYILYHIPRLLTIPSNRVSVIAGSLLSRVCFLIPCKLQSVFIAKLARTFTNL
jgi:hypothetical protein